MGIFLVEIVRVGVILGGNFLWWQFSRCKLFVGNHLGGNFPGESSHVTLNNTLHFYSQSGFPRVSSSSFESTDSDNATNIRDYSAYILKRRTNWNKLEQA